LNPLIDKVLVNSGENYDTVRKDYNYFINIHLYGFKSQGIK